LYNFVFQDWWDEWGGTSVQLSVFHKFKNIEITVNQLFTIEYEEDGLKFNKVHNKMENTWANQHSLMEAETPCNLGDYNMTSSNIEVDVLYEGFLLD